MWKADKLIFRSGRFPFWANELPRIALEVAQNGVARNLHSGCLPTAQIQKTAALGALSQ